MIQKTYKTGTLSEAIAAVKQEMGSHAVIVSTKKMVSKGLFPLKPRPSIEVLAAVDENYLSIEQLNSLQKDPLAKAVPMAIDGDKVNQGVNVSVSAGAERRRFLEKISELEAEVSRLKNLLVKEAPDQVGGETRSTVIVAKETQPLPDVSVVVPLQKTLRPRRCLPSMPPFCKAVG
jgi:flagellar biosynthesis GTPase FlhF